MPKTGLLILLSEGNALLHFVNKIHAYKLLDGSAILKHDWEIQHRCYLWYRAGISLAASSAELSNFPLGKRAGFIVQKFQYRVLLYNGTAEPGGRCSLMGSFKHGGGFPTNLKSMKP